MPLELLGPLVIIGIVAVILVVRQFANTPPRLIQSQQQAREIFRQDFPSVITGSGIFVSTDKTAALFLLENPADSLGLVTVLGSKHVTRLLGAGDINSMIDLGDGTCQFMLNDFTFPQIVLRFPQAGVIEWISDRVATMKQSGHASATPSAGTLS